MLYDPKWEKPKADVFSLEGLIAWLEKQPADEVYDWYDIDGCVLCQYLQGAGGYAEPAAYPGLTLSTIKNWGQQGYFEICGTAPFTFGAALVRARSILSKDSQTVQERT